MQRTAGFWIVAIMVTAGCLSAGCASRPCLTCPELSIPETPTDPAPECGNANDQTWEKIRESLGRSDKAPRVLLISGGGSFGAWGSGFLSGWSEKENGQRPKFDLVTGSSTGAILGTWALLGSMADPNATCAYTDTEDDDVYNKALASWVWLQPWRWRSTPPWVSLKNLRPLRTLFRRYTPPSQVEEVGRVWREEGRVFLVGTVNLELGTFCTWDMGQLAQGMIDASQDVKDRIYEQYMEIVMASSSNPGIFSPTFLPSRLNLEHGEDQDMHVDGGVRHQIFFVRNVAHAVRSGVEQWQRSQAPPGRASRASSEKPHSAPDGTADNEPTVSTSDCNSPDDGKTPRLYSIVNLPGVVPRLCTSHDIYHIAQRSLTVLTIQSMISDLHQIRHQWDGWFTSKPSFCVSRIPDAEPTWPFADDFPECDMRSLYKAAKAKALTDRPWEEEIMGGGPSPNPCHAKGEENSVCPGECVCKEPVCDKLFGDGGGSAEPRKSRR